MVNDLELHNFVTSNASQFFTTFDIDYSFLESDPGLWQESNGYNDALEVVKFLSVTNDNAERGVTQSCKLGGAFRVGFGPKVDKNFELNLGLRPTFCLRCTKI